MDQAENVYAALEEKFPTCAELRQVPVAENAEPMVSLKAAWIRVAMPDGLISPSTGDDIFVRAGVVERLKVAQALLNKMVSGYELEVVYGYRSAAIQNETYQRIRAQAASDNPLANDGALDEIVHRSIAVPDVAGHPTGGAVDVRMIDAQGREVDMGTKAHDFAKRSYTFWPFVSKEVWRNRQILRQCMTGAGFAPFDGEWWHFSYGDREWAFYYGRPAALYTPLTFRP